jgi:hypothetical protein
MGLIIILAMMVGILLPGGLPILGGIVFVLIDIVRRADSGTPAGSAAVMRADRGEERARLRNPPATN